MSRCAISVVCLFLCIVIAIGIKVISKNRDIHVLGEVHLIEQKEREYNKLKAYIEYAQKELLDREREIIDLKSGNVAKATNLNNGGGPSRLSESETGYINKKYDSKDKYDIEKICYMRLKGEPHFANVIKFDDDTLTLTMSHVGKPVTKFTDVPNFKSQITNINTILKKHNIRHGDIHLDNILIKENVLYLIDFEWAVDTNVVKEWQEKTGHSQFYHENKSTQNLWLHKKGFPDPEAYATFQEYIENTYSTH